MAKVTFQPTGGLAFLHQQGPARSAVLHHEQTLAQSQTGVSAVEFIPSANASTKPQPVPSSAPLYETSTLDTLVSQIPLVQTLRAAHTTYKESRPYHSICQTLRQQHYVGGSLFGPGKLALSPYTWTSSQKASADAANTASSLISVFHIGRDLCGHPGYVHGGLLSGLLDEAFASCVSAAFPSGSGMTANLNVDFRKPALPDRLYVLRAEVKRVEGRKAWVEGRLTYLPLAVPMSLDTTRPVSDVAALREDAEGAVMVSEAKALFVEPKFADVSISFSWLSAVFKANSVDADDGSVLSELRPWDD